MKLKLKYAIALLLACVCFSCANGPLKTDRDVVFLVDQSDPLEALPQMDQLTQQFGLDTNMWQGIRVTVSTVSDKDINTVSTVSLEPADQLNENNVLRTARVERFKKDLHAALNGVMIKNSLGRSIIYRTIVTRLNRLATSTASHRYLVVYSDLMENADVSFYDSATFHQLQTEPEAISDKLEKTAVIQNLHGIDVWLIFEPRSYEANTTYMTVARFYKHRLESKGATVHIGNSFNISEQ